MHLLLSGIEFTGSSVEAALIIALIVVGVLLVAALIFATITRIIVWSTYRRYNKVQNSEGLTAKEAAEKFRDLVEIEGVDVQQTTWWRALLSLGGALGFGNNYSIYKKVIFLRRNIIDKSSITAVGVSTQKVGLALQDKEGNKLYRFTARMKPFVFFAPVLFLPISIIGVVIDLLLFNTLGLTSIISVLAAFAFNIMAFLVILFTIKVEKKANKTALELMEKNDFLTEVERDQIKELYRAYILTYTADFIIATLKLISVILKYALKAAKGLKRK